MLKKSQILKTLNVNTDLRVSEISNLFPTLKNVSIEVVSTGAGRFFVNVRINSKFTAKVKDVAGEFFIDGEFFSHPTNGGRA